MIFWLVLKFDISYNRVIISCVSMDSEFILWGTSYNTDFIFVKNWTHPQIGISIPFTCGIGTGSNIFFFFFKWD
jgi:hypothetical protein